MSRQPYMPLFFGDFLAATADWEGEERSLYLTLLGYQWSLGSIPADPRRVCKLVGWERDLFDRCWPVVSTKFHESDGRLYNGRLEDHREKAKSISAKRSESGKAGADARWQMNGKCHEEDMANATSLQCHPIQSNPSKKKNLSGGEPPEWAGIREAYPKRHGDQRWRDALHAANARIREGVTWADLLAGVQRYAAFVRAEGKEGTPYVKQAGTFFGKDGGFAEAWAPKKPSGVDPYANAI